MSTPVKPLSVRAMPPRNHESPQKTPVELWRLSVAVEEC